MKGNDILLIVAIVGLGLVALLSGGVKNSSSGSTSNGGLFSGSNKTTNTPTEKQIGREIKKVEKSVKEIAKEIEVLEENKNASVYKDIIQMSISGRGSTDPKKEYVTLSVSSKLKNPVNITGWQLKSLSTNRSVSIGQAIPLFFSQSSNIKQDVYLKAGEKAYVVTGKGNMNEISFQVNKCSGYHSQFFSFTPSLKQQCPYLEDEPNNIPTTPVNDSCFDFIENLPRCRIQTKPLPSEFTFECRNFILEKMTYASCVSVHKNDPDFYSKEWRLFLGRTESLWKKSREAVVLLDNEGKTVDTVEFD